MKMFGNGTWAVGNTSGTLEDFHDSWHDFEMVIDDGRVHVSIDDKKMVTTDANTVPGMVGVGCGSYHMCSLRHVVVTASENVVSKSV